MGKKKFAAIALNLECETFVVHVTSFFATPFGSTPLDVYLSYRPQIAGLIAEKAPTEVPAKYVNFTDVFSPDLALKLPKYIGINNDFIKLVNANGSIRPSKSSAGASILFHRKLNGSFRLCVDYQGLLDEDLLDSLGKASIRKFYLGPIYLVDPGSTQSTLIHLGVLMIHPRVPRLAPGLLRSKLELASKSESMSKYLDHI